MEAKRVHIIKRGESWAVKKQGNLRASKKFDTKKEAIENAENLRERGYDLIIHRKNGTVEKWKRSL